MSSLEEEHTRILNRLVGVTSEELREQLQNELVEIENEMSLQKMLEQSLEEVVKYEVCSLEKGLLQYNKHIELDMFTEELAKNRVKYENTNLVNKRLLKNIADVMKWRIELKDVDGEIIVIGNDYETKIELFKDVNYYCCILN
jgi:hypothetical protein